MVVEEAQQTVWITIVVTGQHQDRNTDVFQFLFQSHEILLCAGGLPIVYQIAHEHQSVRRVSALDSSPYSLNELSAQWGIPRRDWADVIGLIHIVRIRYNYQIECISFRGHAFVFLSNDTVQFIPQRVLDRLTFWHILLDVVHNIDFTVEEMDTAETAKVGLALRFQRNIRSHLIQ